jgi:CubicO group peptidase (beta-lactamase class C family)
MKARQSFLPFTLGLLDCISASPVLSPRQGLTDTGYNTSTTTIIENVQSNVTSKLLTANITETISKWITAAQIPGLSISITTPDEDEVLTYGQEDALGTPVSNEVSLSGNHGNAAEKETYWGIASNSKLITGMTLAILEQRNTTLPSGEAFTLDTSVVNIIDEFQMWDSNTTESITTRDFLSKFVSPAERIRLIYSTYERSSKS